MTNYFSIFWRHLPKGWHAVVRPSLKSRGICDYRRKKITLQHYIWGRNHLYVFLHEVGHVRIHQNDDARVPLHVTEYEAERYAIAAMRNEGLAVPREELYGAKANVRDAIQSDRKKGIKIDPKIKRWSKR